MTVSHPNQERRRFFRIEDQVYVQFEQQSSEARPKNTQVIYPYINELRKIDVETKHVWHQLQNSDPQIASYLQALNRKIECLAQALLASHDTVVQEANQRIQLSEGGFSGEFDSAFEPGSQHQATMLLFPQRQTLLFTAQCIHCVPLAEATNSEPRYRVGFAFVQINEGDAQLLARHIFTVQANQRRQQHEKNDKSK